MGYLKHSLVVALFALNALGIARKAQAQDMLEDAFGRLLQNNPRNADMVWMMYDHTRENTCLTDRAENTVTLVLRKGESETRRRYTALDRDRNGKTDAIRVDFTPSSKNSVMIPLTGKTPLLDSKGTALGIAATALFDREPQGTFCRSNQKIERIASIKPAPGPIASPSPAPLLFNQNRLVRYTPSE